MPPNLRLLISPLTLKIQPSLYTLIVGTNFTSYRYWLDQYWQQLFQKKPHKLKTYTTDRFKMYEELCALFFFNHWRILCWKLKTLSRVWDVWYFSLSHQPRKHIKYQLYGITRCLVRRKTFLDRFCHMCLFISFTFASL